MGKERRDNENNRKREIFCSVIFLLSALCSLFSARPCHPAMFDRVVAFVDSEAITLSELEQQYVESRKRLPEVTREEVLESMINRLLLLREAKKYRIEAPTEDDVLKEYIDLKIRAFIRVNESELENFYTQNRGQFNGRTYDDVRDEIETLFIEKELNERLRKSLAGLRGSAYIKVQAGSP